jgi:hypothetical protein
VTALADEEAAIRFAETRAGLLDDPLDLSAVSSRRVRHARLETIKLKRAALETPAPPPPAKASPRNSVTPSDTPRMMMSGRCSGATLECSSGTGGGSC